MTIGAREQKVMDVGGTRYDAVTMKYECQNCAGCAFVGAPLTCAIAGCLPAERDDGMYAIWMRRITNTPVEA